MPTTGERGNVKERTGKIVSARMNKTVIVAVDRLVQHPLYGKTLRRTKKPTPHHDQTPGRDGDTVRVLETRPLSALKRWRVSAILERAK